MTTEQNKKPSELHEQDSHAGMLSPTVLVS